MYRISELAAKVGLSRTAWLNNYGPLSEQVKQLEYKMASSLAKQFQSTS